MPALIRWRGVIRHPAHFWQRAAKVPVARSSPAARADATRVSHGSRGERLSFRGAKGLRSALWLRAAKVAAARSSPAARADATRVSHGSRGERLSSRSSERATVGTCAARGRSACGPFVSGSACRCDTRVAWARSMRLSSRGAKGLRSANAPRAAQARAARSSAAALAEATRVSHERRVNGWLVVGGIFLGIRGRCFAYYW